MASHVNLPDAKQEITTKLEQAIAYRREAARKDFFWLQIMSWLSFISSFLTSIFVAIGIVEGDIAKFLVALIAGIPALVVAAESGLNFATRHKMNEDASFEFESLLFDIKNNGKIEDVFSKYIDYCRKFSREFPSGTVVPTIPANKLGTTNQASDGGDVTPAAAVPNAGTSHR